MGVESWENHEIAEEDAKLAEAKEEIAKLIRGRSGMTREEKEAAIHSLVTREGLALALIDAIKEREVELCEKHRGARSLCNKASIIFGSLMICSLLSHADIFYTLGALAMFAVAHTGRNLEKNSIDKSKELLGQLSILDGVPEDKKNPDGGGDKNIGSNNEDVAYV